MDAYSEKRIETMSKSRLPLGAVAGVALLTLAGPAPLRAGIVGQDAQACASGKPSILVRVTGFKEPTGEVKVSLYDSNPKRYLARKGKIRKVLVPVRGGGPLDVCIAVPRPGRYAVAVHHDINRSGKKDRRDGGGYSGNPRVSVTNLKPPFSQTAINVGNAPARVAVRLMYLKGLSIGPASS